MMSSPLMILLLATLAFSSDAFARNEKQEIETIIRGDDVSPAQKAASHGSDEPLEAEDKSEPDDMAIPLTQGFFGDMGDEEKKAAAEAEASENTKIFYVKEREPHQNLNGHPVLDPAVVEKVSAHMEEREKKKKTTWWDQFMQFLGVGS